MAPSSVEAMWTLPPQSTGSLCHMLCEPFFETSSGCKTFFPFLFCFALFVEYLQFLMSNIH